MKITNTRALSVIMAASLDGIFNGDSVDSMTPTPVLWAQLGRCRAFMEMVGEFTRNMEPLSISADSIDAVSERMEWLTRELGDGPFDY